MSDVLVVGAGPAGLACAATLLAHGQTVTVIDAGARPGGQFWRHAEPAIAADPAYAALHHDLGTYRLLVARLEEGVAAGRAAYLAQHHAWAVTPTASGWEAAVVDRTTATVRERRLTADAVVIATGAHDLTMPFPGWDLPGVMTAGAVQALLKGNGVLAGRRVAVAGTGPFLLPVAAGVAAYGGTVVGVFEATAPAGWLRHVPAVARSAGKVTEGAGYAVALARHRVPVHQRTVVVAADGDGRLESVTVARVDPTGTAVSGTERTLSVDALGVGHGFAPVVDLAVTAGATVVAGPAGTWHVVTGGHGQCIDAPGLFAAGETTGVGGAGLALAEGERAAYGVLRAVGRPVETARERLLRGRIARLRRFAEAMHTVHPVPSGWTQRLPDATVLCRCEEVTVGAVRAAVAAGADDARQVKQLTRAGMGWCQGRICEPAVCGLLTASGRSAGAVTPRLIATPVPLGALADAQ